MLQWRGPSPGAPLPQMGEGTDMNRIDALTEHLRQAHGETAMREALRLSWDARIAGAPEKSDRLLSAAIRLCRPA
jgi:hypothetical protein